MSLHGESGNVRLNRPLIGGLNAGPKQPAIQIQTVDHPCLLANATFKTVRSGGQEWFGAYGEIRKYR